MTNQTEKSLGDDSGKNDINIALQALEEPEYASVFTPKELSDLWHLSLKMKVEILELEYARFCGMSVQDSFKEKVRAYLPKIPAYLHTKVIQFLFL